MKKLILALTIAASLTSCTDNARSRQFGGTETIVLPVNYVLVNCTWKETDLWLLTKDTTTGQLFFNEKSSWGILEGSIFFENK